MPLLTRTPKRSGFSLPISRAESAIAIFAAAMANWAKRSVRRTSFGLLKLGQITGAHVTHASGNGADQILAAIVDFSGTEQDLFQRSSGANSDPCPTREISMWGCHSPVITAAGCFLGFGKCASHHYG